MPERTLHENNDVSVKCNDSKIVLEVLASLGTGFDCASQEEIKKVLSLGVHSNRIIFANPTKKPRHIKLAAETGVDLMTFDSTNELYKIKTFHPNAKLLIRIKYDDLSANFVLGEKFGCDYETEAPDLLRVASTLQLNVIGVCFHIGSGSKIFSIFSKAIAAARHVFDVAVSVGYNFSLLDIGGGFPGATGTSIKEIGVIINTALEEHFRDPSVKVIAEPGTYYVASAFTLASNVHSVKSIIETDPVTRSKRKSYKYYVDTGVYGALISVIFNEYFITKTLKTNANAKLYPSIVFGPTCDKVDKISENENMLPELSVGDWIIFEDTGAYTLSIACEFNGFPTPKLHSIIDRKDWLLLTEKTQFPMSKDRFVLGTTLENFRTGLTGPNYFRTNYF